MEEGNPIQYGFMPNHDVRRLKELIDAGETSGYVYAGERIFPMNRQMRKWDTDGECSRQRRGEHRRSPRLCAGFRSLFNDIKQYALARWDKGDAYSMAMRLMMHFMVLNSGEDRYDARIPWERGTARGSVFGKLVRAAFDTGHCASFTELRVSERRLGFVRQRRPGCNIVLLRLGRVGDLPGDCRRVGGVTLVAPSFRQGEVSLPDGRSIKILANKESMRDRFVRSMTRDGRT